MDTQITATVTLNFDIAVGLNAEVQRARIEDDLGRLYDADSTTGIACTGFEIDAIKPPPTSRIHFLCASQQGPCCHV